MTTLARARRHRVGAAAIILVVAALLIGGFAMYSKSEGSPTFGTVPAGVLDPARSFADQPIGPEDRVPDYIVVWGPDGEEAGYVSSWDLLGTDGIGKEGDLTVVNRDLEIVGSLTPGGFVLLGEPIPDVPITVYEEAVG